MALSSHSFAFSQSPQGLFRKRRVLGALTALTLVGGTFVGISAASAAPNPLGEAIIDAAMSQKGKPYVWGGGDASGPTGGGFDCSGLVEYAYAKVGINIGGWTGPQFEDAQKSGGALQSVSTKNLKKGDLVFFENNNSTKGAPDHVGIYVGKDAKGNTIIVDSSSKGVGKSTTTYKGKIVGAARPTAKAAANSKVGKATPKPKKTTPTPAPKKNTGSASSAKPKKSEPTPKKKTSSDTKPKKSTSSSSVTVKPKANSGDAARCSALGLSKGNTIHETDGTTTQC